MLEDKVILDEQTPLFECVCQEPEGAITRRVYPMALTPDNLKRFWELTSKFRILFDAEVSDFQQFCELLMSRDGGDNLSAHGLFWKIDDFVGVYYMTNIAAHDAQIHYSFFDRRQRGRQQLTRMIIKYVFEQYGFRRLSAEIPYAAKGTFQFVEQVGLKHEGRKRKSILFDNEWFDARCYGILREEADQWA